METIKSFAAFDPKKPLAPFTFNQRPLRDNDVVIEIKYCGVCHSDIHQARDEWGGSMFPMVPGHEIVGVVKKLGSRVTRFKVGDKVGVGCLVDSCLDCPSCREGLEQYCENGFVGTYNSVEKDKKTPTYGGYAKEVIAREEFVLKIPENLSLQGVAPLLCAGITTYSPLRHWKAGPGKKVAVVGLGGLGHMAVKIGHAMGADITVLSHSDKKKEDSKRLGANSFYSTADGSVFKNHANEFDLIICTVSAKIDWNQYLGLVKRDGAMVLLGIPENQVPVSAFPLIMGRKALAGSLIGGIKETQEMLDFCGKHNITSDIELIKMEQINEAYERMMNGDVRYRFVIDIENFAK